MKPNKVATSLILFSVVIFSMCSCFKNSISNSSSQIRLHLTDDPANFEHVYLNIQQVGVTMAGSDEVVLTAIHPGIYDILRFRNGIDTLLVRSIVPIGNVSQIRLILGNNNSVVVFGISYPLNTPSAQESCVKLNLKQTFVATGTYDIWLDFDAGKSIVPTATGSYKLRPAIRAFCAATSGIIRGYVVPVSAMATVYAANGTDTVSAIPNATDGYFVLNGLNAASYLLLVNPEIPYFLPYSQANVSVTNGIETNVGIIALHN